MTNLRFATIFLLFCFFLNSGNLISHIDSLYCLQPTPNQPSECTAGWALATTMALRNRFCRKYGWNFDWDLSSQQIIACSRNKGCEGGSIQDALLYAEIEGLTTELCYPFEDNHDPVCRGYRNSCPSDIKTDKGKIFKVMNTRKLLPSQISDEISKNGAVPTCFNLYDDFYIFFKQNATEIYPPIEDAHKYEGILCAIIVGSYSKFDVKWGKERNAWILQGVWGKEFAHNGFFSIEQNFIILGKNITSCKNCINCLTRDLKLEENFNELLKMSSYFFFKMHGLQIQSKFYKLI